MTLNLRNLRIQSPQRITRDILQSRPSDYYLFFTRVIYNRSFQNMMHMNSCQAKSSQKAEDRSNIMAPLTTQQLQKSKDILIHKGISRIIVCAGKEKTVDQRNPRPRFETVTVGASTIILSLYSCCPLASLNPFLPSWI